MNAISAARTRSAGLRSLVAQTSVVARIDREPSRSCASRPRSPTSATTTASLRAPRAIASSSSDFAGTGAAEDADARASSDRQETVDRAQAGPKRNGHGASRAWQRRAGNAPSAPSDPRSGPLPSSGRPFGVERAAQRAEAGDARVRPRRDFDAIPNRDAARGSERCNRGPAPLDRDDLPSSELDGAIRMRTPSPTRASGKAAKIASPCVRTTVPDAARDQTKSAAAVAAARAQREARIDLAVAHGHEQIAGDERRIDTHRKGRRDALRSRRARRPARAVRFRRRRAARAPRARRDPPVRASARAPGRRAPATRADAFARDRRPPAQPNAAAQALRGCVRKWARFDARRQAAASGGATHSREGARRATRSFSATAQHRFVVGHDRRDRTRHARDDLRSLFGRIHFQDRRRGCGGQRADDRPRRCAAARRAARRAPAGSVSGNRARRAPHFERTQRRPARAR